MDKGSQIANKRLSLRLIIFWRWINLRAKSTSWNLLKELMEQTQSLLLMFFQRNKRSQHFFAYRYIYDNFSCIDSTGWIFDGTVAL